SAAAEAAAVFSGRLRARLSPGAPKALNGWGASAAGALLLRDRCRWPLWASRVPWWFISGSASDRPSEGLSREYVRPGRDAVGRLSPNGSATAERCAASSCRPLLTCSREQHHGDLYSRDNRMRKQPRLATL